MADFEGILAGIPGLGGALAKEQYNLKMNQAYQQQEESSKIKGILSSDNSIEDKIKDLTKTGQTGITLATHLTALQKSQQDAGMNAEIQKLIQGGGGTTGGGITPDVYRAIGLKMGLAGKVGGSALASEADRLDKLAADRIALSGMKSRPEMQAVGEQGPNIPAPAKPGVIPDYLLNDPQFGPSAKALQGRINSGVFPTATAAEAEVSRLSTAHNAALQARAMAAVRGEEARKTKQTAPAMSADGILTPEGVEAAATAYNINKTMPSNLGRGNQGSINTVKILNRAAEQQKDAGNTAEATAIQQIANKSSTLALNSLSKDLAAIGPFHDMLNTNAEIAIKLAKNIASSRTGSQLVNRPLSWLQNNAADNPNIAEYLFQMQIVKTEGARILNNPRLVGQLTDSARAEMGNVINGNMPLGQTERVLKRMMADGDNRVNAMKSQREVLLGSMKIAPTKADTVPEFATEADAARAGLKAGDRVKIGGQTGTWK